jgi:hypothetical protein
VGARRQEGVAVLTRFATLRADGAPMENVGPNGLGTMAPARLVAASAATGAVIGALVGLVWAGLAVGMLQAPPVIDERGAGSAALILVAGLALFAFVGGVALGTAGAVVGLVVGIAAVRGISELPVLGALLVVAAVLAGDPYHVARGFSLALRPSMDLGLEMVVGMAVPLVLGAAAAAYHGWAVRRLAGITPRPAPALVRAPGRALVVHSG